MRANELWNELAPAGGDEDEAQAGRVGGQLSITTVRSATDREAVEALVRCHRSGAAAGGASSEPADAALTGAPAPGRCARLLLARLDGRPVGVARISWDAARRAGEVRRGRLSHLYVEPGARLGGVGEALVRRAAVVAWWSGCHDLRVRPAAWPADALGLLRRVGFCEALPSDLSDAAAAAAAEPGATGAPATGVTVDEAGAGAGAGEDPAGAAADATRELVLRSHPVHPSGRARS